MSLLCSWLPPRAAGHASQSRERLNQRNCGGASILFRLFRRASSKIVNTIDKFAGPAATVSSPIRLRASVGRGLGWDLLEREGRRVRRRQVDVRDDSNQAIFPNN